MLTIRFQRVGRRNDPSFRLIVTDSHKSPKTGSYLELLGSYNPKTKATILKKDRILTWHKNGAQISDTVHNLLIKEGVIEGKKINVLPRKSPIKKEGEEVAAAAAPVAEVAAAEAAPTEVEMAAAEAPVEEVMAEVEESPAEPEVVAEAEVAPAEPEVAQAEETPAA